MLTKKAIINIGVNEGYYNNNDNSKLNSFYKYLQNFIKENSESIGEYISFVAYPVKTVYGEDFGCPKGGEDTYILTATARPQFVKDINKWELHVQEYVRRMKKELKQITVSLEFIDVDFVYFTQDSVIQ